MDYQKRFVKVYRLLLPNGRAWNIHLSNFFLKVIDGMTQVCHRLKSLFIIIKETPFPYLTNSIAEWEQQFYLIGVNGMTEEQRRDRLAAQWAAQGGQSPSYIEYMLSTIGITAKVYENLGHYSVTMFDGTTCGDGATCDTGTWWDPNYFISIGCQLLVNGFIPDKTYAISPKPSMWGYYFVVADPSGIEVPLIIPIELRSTFITTLLQIKPTNTRALINAHYTDDTMGDGATMGDGSTMVF
jgi:uncharacterized protein YmfQ (DUF2313 family)